MRDQDNTQNLSGKKRAVSLLSGGLDSTTLLSYVVSLGYEVIALSFDYGQRHGKELDSAKKVADFYHVKHKVMRIDLRAIGGSALTDDIPVPDMPLGEIGKEIPATYVPARNTILLSIALGLAEVTDSSKIFIGANSLDYSGYPDCRPEYFDSINKTFNLATKRTVEGGSIEVEAPLLKYSKADIVRLAAKLKTPLELTWSCYSGKDKACGLCDSCKLRLKGFMEAGSLDPIEYENLPDFYSDYVVNRK
ncbi:MAG: 7-cyano-7-deazaguanine synthase QueC [Thermoplasmatales archaeon]|nr:7-cyano-7-deazaguanine synthase QueC [Candidatus Thermoplasmatota archaeon]MDA8054282.1 7-cyano-7-deazaguanine synthase QueC [Thermoplasmatales archaeon]